MEVCQYYLRGYCRFGDRCRNEHPGADNDYRHQQNYGARQQLNFSYNESQNRFAPLSTPASATKAKTGNNTQNIHDLTTDEIISVISQEVELWESSRMWPFSCFAFSREVCSMPGLDDISVEEIHLKACEAQALSNFQSYEKWLAELTSQYVNIKEQLKRPNAQTRMKLTEFINEVKCAQNSSSTSNTTFGSSKLFASTGVSATSVFGGNTSATQPFGSATSSTQWSQPFGSATSVFGGSSTTQPFGSATSTTQPFGGATSTTHPFGGATSTTQPFGGATSTTQPFGGATSTTQPFGAATSTTQPFGGATSTTQPFGGATSTTQPFGGATPSTQPFGCVTSTTQPFSTGFASGSVTQANNPAEHNTAAEKARAMGLFGSGGATRSTFGSKSSGELRAPPNAAAAELFPSKSSTGNFTIRSGGLFGKGGLEPAQSFGDSQGVGAASDKEGSQFSDLGELSALEKAAFEASSFTLGLVPTRPPPREMV